MADLEQARAAKSRVRAALLGHEGVEGVGLAPEGTGGYCVRVNVLRAAAAREVPAAVDGVPVHVRVVGPVRARADDAR